MACSEKKNVVPANPGFYVVSPVLEDPGVRVVDTYCEPVVAWEITSDGVVQPITYGGATRLSSEGDYDVLCPNGTVVSENDYWGSLEEWLSCQN